jgi:hypothetical protein
MSEQVPVSNLEVWVKKKLSSEISQAERERDKLLSEIARALDVLPQTCGQLSRKGEQDMEMKRNNRAEYRAAKSVVRLTGIIQNMCGSAGIVSSKDSASLRNLQREISKLASDCARSREEWLRQIRPYYIIDMMTLGGNIDKVKRLAEELHGFLMGRGSVLRSLEELEEKLHSLTEFRNVKESKSSSKRTLEERIKETVRIDHDLRKEVEAVRANPKMAEYLSIDSKLKELRGELLRTGFSRLGRPLKKLISISERGTYPLPVEVRDSAKEYVKKPFTTFLTEDEGYPRLKAVISALSVAVSSGKLALKQREAKKVVERNEQIVTGESLARIHAQAGALKKTYDALLADEETAQLVNRLKDTRQKGRGNRALQEDLKAEFERTNESERRIDDQIRVHVKDLEGFVRNLSKLSPRLLLA